MFKRKPVFSIVEVEKAPRLPELTTELREGISQLQHIPAFQYLLAKSRVQKAAMQAQLNNGLDLPENALRCLQAGIYWLTFLDREITTATKIPILQRSAHPSEQEEFNKIHSAVELIGQE